MKKIIIGVDLGGTKISAASADEKGNIICKKTIPTEAKKGLKHVISNIEKSILYVCHGAGATVKNIKCIGIGTPGTTDSAKGIVSNSPNLPGWKKVPLKNIISKKFNKPAIIENDANCAALAELKMGAGKKFKDFVYITVSTGIGGGIIIDKKLFKGSNGNAGEIGHTTIDLHGPKCLCGRYGHLEGMASGTAIRKRSGVSPVELSALAKKGNKKAIKEIKYAGYLTGIGLSNLVNILDPEAIIVGGGIANFGKIFFDSIRKTVKENAISRVKILPAKLKHDTGLHGALALCL